MPRLACLLLAAFASGVTGLSLAQSPDDFSAKLTWVPVSLAELRLVGGEGAATATLARGRLSIEGTFASLPAAATAASLHLGPATGASGPAIAELRIDKATAGALDGAIELDRAQREALLAGHLYIQIYAEPGVPPDNGVLRGWLLGYPAPAGAGRGQ